MSQKIYWTRDWNSVDVPRDKSALWVAHKSDVSLIQAERVMDASIWADNPKPKLNGVDILVVAGLVSRIMRGGNRLKYGRWLTDPWFGPPRISVDSHIFFEKPWTVWFHFGCVDAPFANYFTSYRLESDWNRYIDTERREHHPCQESVFESHSKGVVDFSNGFTFDPVTIETIETSKLIKADYAEEKELAFEDEKTPAAIIKRLAKFAQSRCQERSIPDSLFKSPVKKIVSTDLGVDRYLCLRHLELVDLTNKYAEAVRCQ